MVVLMVVARPLLLAPLVAAVLVAGCTRAGTITVNDGDQLVCTAQVAAALRLAGHLDAEPDTNRVVLTYAAVVDDSERPFPGLAPTAIPVSDPASLIVEYVDTRTVDALCAQVAFDTYTVDGERSFVVRMLRERDQFTLADGQFSIMIQP